MTRRTSLPVICTNVGWYTLERFGSIQDYIDRLEAKIDFYRYKARKLRFRGRMLRWPIPIVISIIGALSAFSVLLESARVDPLIGGPKIAHLESAIFDPHPIIWGLLYAIGPPTVPGGAGGDRMGFFIWLVGWMILFLGVMLLGERALKKAGTLEARAEKDEDILVAHRPTWIHLEQMSRHLETLQGGGSGNVTTVIHQITKMINRPEEDKNWWALPSGIILIGVVTVVIGAALTKALGLTQ